MLRTVFVGGKLGEKFGSEFRLDISSVGEAIRAINANKPGFLRSIKKDKSYNVTVGTFTEKDALNNETVFMKHRKGDMWIMPSIEGSKSGIGTVVLGAVLVVVGMVLTSYGLGAVGAPMMKIGVGMMISGVAMMLTPTPGTGDYKDREKPDERQSFMFDGPVNTNEQGGAIPIIFGQVLMGSTVVSTALDVEQIPIPPPPPPEPDPVQPMPPPPPPRDR